MRDAGKQPVFIGDEWSAAGYRLAGAEVMCPEPEALPQAFRAALASGAPLVLIGADAAGKLDAAELEQARAALAPPVTIVTDVRQNARPADLAARLRRRLGVAA